MISKNDASDIKILPYIRIFFILFALFLTFYLGKVSIDAGDSDIKHLLSIEFVPAMFVLIILYEACFTKYIDRIEIYQDLINIKYGNGYINKTLLLNKNDIISFNVDIVIVDRWYYTKSSSKYITFDTFINVQLKNGNSFLLKDNLSGLEITKLLCSVYKEIPNFKFLGTIHNELDEDISKKLDRFRNYYNQLLNIN